MAKSKKAPEVKEKGGEGAKERSQVQMALEQPEVAELVSQLKLREQYNKAVDVLKNTGFLAEDGSALPGDIPMPATFEEAISLLSSDPKELERLLAIAKDYYRPTFLLVPQANVDSDKSIWESPYPNWKFSRNDTNEEKIIKWKVVVTEGEQEMPFLEGDDVTKTTGERANFRRHKRKKGEKGMTYDVFSMLHLRLKENGELLDEDTRTLMDGNPKEGKNVHALNPAFDRFTYYSHTHGGSTDDYISAENRFRRVLSGNQ